MRKRAFITIALSAVAAIAGLVAGRSSADGILLIQTGASGKLIVVAADSDSFRELRQMTVFTDNPETGTAPVLANGRIHCHSYAGEVVDLQRTPP